MVTAARTRSGRGGRRRVAWTAGALVALAVAVRLPALFSARHLGFDDGVYGVSVLGMRAGQRPFEDLFSPQGPLHLPLLWLGDVLGLRTANSPRVASVAAGVAATLAAWRAGRYLGPPAGAALAGVLVATTGSMLWTTGPITGDGIANAFALTAVWAALAHRERPAAARAVAVGLAMGAAVSVKSIVVLAAIPVGWYLWSSRRAGHFALAVATSVGVGLAATLPFGFDRVWEQSVAYHRDSEYLYGPAAQAWKLVTTLAARDLPLLAVLALGLVAAARGAPGRRFDADTVVLVAWFLAACAFLVFEPTMFRNHIAMVIGPLALLVAMRPPPLRWAAATLLLAAPWWAAHLGDVLRPRDYRGQEAALVAELRALPTGTAVISDEPGFAWRAGHHAPPWLNDASVKRVRQGSITVGLIAEAAARPDTCAVVVWSRRYGAELPGLPEALADAGYVVAATFGGDTGVGPRTLYVDPACAP